MILKLNLEPAKANFAIRFSYLFTSRYVRLKASDVICDSPGDSIWPMYARISTFAVYPTQENQLFRVYTETEDADHGITKADNG